MDKINIQIINVIFSDYRVFQVNPMSIRQDCFLRYYHFLYACKIIQSTLLIFNPLICLIEQYDVAVHVYML
jgi:hypothetical protein